MSAGTANAAAKWECTGPAVACSSHQSAAKSKKASAKVYKSSKKVAYKAKTGKRTASYAKKKSKASRSYSGGSSGIASYYWQPQRVASGGWFNPNALTAAHKTLPFGTRVRVTNRNNGRSVVVTINDRGPYIKGRVIDLSRRAAQVVGMTGSGVAPVSYTIVGRS
jgi:rare lipoprotein A